MGGPTRGTLAVAVGGEGEGHQGGRLQGAVGAVGAISWRVVVGGGEGEGREEGREILRQGSGEGKPGEGIWEEGGRRRGGGLLREKGVEEEAVMHYEEGELWKAAGT